MSKRFLRSAFRFVLTRPVTSCVVLLTAACSGLNDPIAGYDNARYNSALYAINGTPIGVATAINTATALTVRAEVGYDFDVAFDLDGTGKPVVISQRAVGMPQNAIGHPVALQAATGTFESVAEAPSKGWVTDSLLTVAVGQPFVVRTTANVCQVYASPYIYSKAVVDSIDVPARRLYLSVVTDPNCGFRSFSTGRPTH
jgi:hypothetical protein